MGDFSLFKWRLFWFWNKEKLRIQMIQYLQKLIFLLFLQILKVRQLNFKSLCKCISKSQLENIILLSFFPRRRLSYNYYYYWYWHIFQQLESIYSFVMDWNRVMLLTQFIIWWVYIIEHYPQTSVTKPVQLCLAQLWHICTMNND